MKGCIKMSSQHNRNFFIFKKKSEFSEKLKITKDCFTFHKLKAILEINTSFAS